MLTTPHATQAAPIPTVTSTSAPPGTRPQSTRRLEAWAHGSPMRQGMARASTLAPTCTEMVQLKTPQQHTSPSQ